MNDHELNQLLAAAKESPVSLPRGFKPRVWQDIELRMSCRSADWLENLAAFLSLPGPRLALWAVALGVGLLAGARTSKPSDPASVYAYSINPVAPAIQQ